MKKKGARLNHLGPMTRQRMVAAKRALRLGIAAYK
jgi:hypothetical protein